MDLPLFLGFLLEFFDEVHGLSMLIVTLVIYETRLESHEKRANTLVKQHGARTAATTLRGRELPVKLRAHQQEGWKQVSSIGENKKMNTRSYSPVSLSLLFLEFISLSLYFYI